MAITDVSMCSNALLLLGHEAITSIPAIGSETGAGERAAANFYTYVFHNLVTSYPWRFAMKKDASLTKDGTAPLNEWTNSFQLPTDYLLAYRTYPRSPYEVYGNFIFSDQDTLAIDYWFEPAEADLPGYFVVLMQYALAAEFAISVTDNRSLAEMFEVKAEKQFLIATNRDSQSRPNYAIESAPFIEVR